MSTSQHNPAPEFVRAMEPVARELLGEPNAELSSRFELRFGSRGSLAVRLDTGTWHDHEAGHGGGVLDMVQQRQQLDKGAAVAWMRERGHLTAPVPAAGRRQVATYDYTDEDGVLLFQVVRFQPKDFRQRRPNGSGWTWKTADVRKVLYRLPETMEAVAAGRTIYVVEGEKAVHALVELGLDATCSPGGAGKWRRDYSPTLAGADVVVLPDHDEPGRLHGIAVAAAVRAVARRVRVVDLPGLPDKGDVADWIAAGHGWEDLETAVEEAVDRPLGPNAVTCDAPSADPGDVTPAFCTDDALALQFSARYAHQLRHVAAWGKWLEWTGTHWRPDPTMATFDRARAICREASKSCNSPKIASKVASASTVAAVERLAKADRRHAATVEQWDSDPWLLNTPGGVVDLRTGKTWPHAPSDHLTKITAVAPGGACPKWHAFLARVTAGNAELQRYLQRMAGYCLTGSIREHALFFAYGTGANGKGVTINTMTGIMGDYATVASIETFTASTSDRHPTDLAMLRGARLVTAQETEEGRRWAESRIKAMTGGDPITARFMRQDFFTFEPTFKLLIAGNHRPGLRNVDEAIRRRFNLIPFDVRIPPEERDLDLPEKLRAEWPGILAWAIEGCLEWQRIGLSPPEAVIDATEEYLEAEDAMAGWIMECCTLHKTFLSSSSEMYASWKAWAEAAGELPGSQRRFTQALASRGYQQERLSTGARGFRGIAMKPDEQGGRYGD